MGGILIAKTPEGGMALVNGVQSFLTYMTPDDGQIGLYALSAYVNVVSTETGGEVDYACTLYGQAEGAVCDGGGGAPGASVPFEAVFAADPNTKITVSQTTALTGGAAFLNAHLIRLA